MLFTSKRLIKSWNVLNFRLIKFSSSYKLCSYKKTCMTLYMLVILLREYVFNDEAWKTMFLMQESVTIIIRFLKCKKNTILYIRNKSHETVFLLYSELSRYLDIMFLYVKKIGKKISISCTRYHLVKFVFFTVQWTIIDISNIMFLLAHKSK